MSGVPCVLTGLPINSGTAGVVPLMRPRFHERFGGPEGQHAPLTYPIFCGVGDYGVVEDIVQDDNTRLIEDCTDMVIEDFMDEVTDFHGGDRKRRNLKRVAVCYIHPDVCGYLLRDVGDRFANARLSDKLRGKMGDGKFPLRLDGWHLDWWGLAEKRFMLGLERERLEHESRPDFKAPEEKLHRKIWNALGDVNKHIAEMEGEMRRFSLVPFERKQLPELYYERMPVSARLQELAMFTDLVRHALLCFGRIWRPPSHIDHYGFDFRAEIAELTARLARRELDALDRDNEEFEHGD